MKTIKLFNFSILNFKMNDAVVLIEKNIIKKENSNFFFVNADCINISFKDPYYKNILLTSPYIFGDGIGIKIASHVFNTPTLDNVNGTDMFPFLCDLCQKKNYSIFLLGGKPGIAEKLMKELHSRYPGIKIAGFHHGYFDRKTESDHIIKTINESDSDILFVAFGVPLQEKWLMEHFNEIHVPIRMGVGGLFDFYSNTIPRAPLWMRRIGMEWFFRLIQEPRRMWKRYIIGNPLFLFRAIAWRALKTNNWIR